MQWCAGSPHSSTRLDRLKAMQSLIWFLRWAGGSSIRPGFGTVFEDYGLSIGWLCAALRLVCGFSAEWCKPRRRPRNGGVSLWRWLASVVWTSGLLARAVFRFCFSYKQTNVYIGCMVFCPGFSYKLGQLFSIYTDC